MSLFPANWSNLSVKILSRPIGSPIGGCEDGDGDGMCTPKGGTEDNVPVVVTMPVEARGKHSKGKGKGPNPAGTSASQPAQSATRKKDDLYTPGVPPGMERIDARMVFTSEEASQALGGVAVLMSEIHGVDPFDGHRDVKVTLGPTVRPSALGSFGAQSYMPAGWWDGVGQLTGEIIVNDVNTRQKSERAFTFAHETGHRIDVTPYPGVPGQVIWWSHTDTPAVLALFSALNGLDSHQERTAYWRNRLQSGLKQDDVDYLLSRHEIWARLYSQWIAEELKKRGNPGLMEVVKRMRDPNSAYSLGGFLQFSEEEMDVLRPLIVDVLAERGLVEK